MNRLTTSGRFPHGAEGVSIYNLTGNYCRGEYEATAVTERLSAYEDTGLTPEQIPEMSQMFREKCEEVNRYEKLKEHGQLIELPCKVGDIVYSEVLGELEAIKVTGFSCGKLMNDNEDDCDEEDYLHDDMDLLVHFDWRYGTCSRYASDFGKKVFLTREEAEKALAANEQDTKQE